MSSNDDIHEGFRTPVANEHRIQFFANFMLLSASTILPILPVALTTAQSSKDASDALDPWAVWFIMPLVSLFIGTMYALLGQESSWVYNPFAFPAQCTIFIGCSANLGYRLGVVFDFSDSNTICFMLLMAGLSLGFFYAFISICTGCPLEDLEVYGPYGFPACYRCAEDWKPRLEQTQRTSSDLYCPLTTSPPPQQPNPHASTHSQDAVEGTGQASVENVTHPSNPVNSPLVSSSSSRTLCDADMSLGLGSEVSLISLPSYTQQQQASNTEKQNDNGNYCRDASEVV